jgi:hypothetical protein
MAGAAVAEYLQAKPNAVVRAVRSEQGQDRGELFLAVRTCAARILDRGLDLLFRL